MADNCNDILKAGVYEHHISIKTGNLEQDYKHYFASDEFRKDFREFKFKYGVEAIIDAIPLKLNADANDVQLSEFQKKVRESTSFSLTQSFFEQSVHSLPNKAVLEAWQTCMEERFGFKITNEVVGNSVVFKLRYNNFGQTDLPTLQRISISGGLLVSRTKEDNEKIHINEEIVVICTFTENSILISFDTDFTAITDSASKETKGKSKDHNPVGTIICSYLNWQEFQNITDNNKYTSNSLWNSEFSFWSPCDGRRVDKSDFFKVTDKAVPDLRGVFLRGLNSFDRYENDNGISTVSDTQKDLEQDRVRGSFQKDAFARHTHAVSQTVVGLYAKGDADDPSPLVDYPGTRNSTSSVTGESDETRPKNVAIYYYIKIN